ncbi:squalene/phytoene synthase family protein [Oceanicella actignis]|uniref:squalene/phytoene synthase family protein n=1 Tax=Oceanicella actignis TaxID=1189325 RepID=UPI0011E7A87D|nr:squalene/phytoene synthase family protein [Oceanicella actignis]TYO89873.1 phytoene/squalene synthetase [Oceanicella actignis]
MSAPARVPAHDADAEACAELLRRGDPDRLRTALAAGDKAPRLLGLYAFNLEVARIASAAREPILAQMRLQWWRDALERLHAGGAAADHPALAPLAEAMAAARLDRALFDRYLDARALDPEGPSFAEEGALHAYLADTGGALMRLAARALLDGADADALAVADEAAAHMGWASAAANLTRALPALYARGAEPLPLDAPADRAAMAEGRTPPALRPALAALARAGLGRLARARALRRRVPRAAAPAFLAGWEAERILRAAARPDYDMFSGHQASEFRRRGSLALRALTGLW